MLRFTFRQERMDMTMYTTRDFELVPVPPTKSIQADFTLNQALLSNGTERKSGRCSAMDIQLGEGVASWQKSMLDHRSLSLSPARLVHMADQLPSQAITITSATPPLHTHPPCDRHQQGQPPSATPQRPYTFKPVKPSPQHQGIDRVSVLLSRLLHSVRLLHPPQPTCLYATSAQACPACSTYSPSGSHTFHFAITSPSPP